MHIIICLYRRLQGVREGTVAAALLVGLIAKQIGKFLAGWKLEDC